VWHVAKNHLEAAEQSLQEKAAWCPAICVGFANLQVPAMLLKIATEVIEDARARAHNDQYGLSNEYGNEAHDPLRGGISPFVCAALLPDTPVLVALLEEGVWLLAEMQNLIGELHNRWEILRNRAGEAFYNREKTLVKGLATSLLQQAQGNTSTGPRAPSQGMVEIRARQFMSAPINELLGYHLRFLKLPELSSALRSYRQRAVAFQKSTQEMLPRSTQLTSTDLENGIWRQALMTKLPLPNESVLAQIMRDALTLAAQEDGYEVAVSQTICAHYTATLMAVSL